MDPLNPSQNSQEDSRPIQDGISDPTPPLHLPIDDDELLSVLRQKEKDAKQYFDSTLELRERQKRNRDFWRGKHYKDGTGFEDWQSDFQDNAIYEDLETRITLASARMPDIIVTPPNDTNESVEKARVYEKILNSKVNSATTQRTIKRGLRFHHLNFFAVLKGRWDPNLANGTGDFVFELVRRDRILFDYTATVPDTGFTADNMDYIIEYIEEPVSVVLAKFPRKRQELLARVSADKTLKKVGSKMVYQECWFTWYDLQGQIYEGVCWKFQDLILDKKRNPYYDWEGYQVPQPRMDSEGDFKPAGSLTKEQRFYNYFERPRKPYIFFSYQNLDESPIDDTTPVEQAIPLQKVVNRTGRLIVEISENTVPKKVIAGKFMEKEAARELTSDPDEIIYLDGADNANEGISTIAAAPPSPELLALQNAARLRIDALFSAHPTTKGENTGDQSGLSKQVSREGDLTMSDDLVDIVVERVIYEQACWATQFMKLFYDQPHYVRRIGQDGSLLYQEFGRQDIQDGVLIDVKASSIDAMTRRSDAINLASRKAIDPLTMFEDMEMPNPKERVRRLISFLNGGNDAFATYMAEIDVEMEHQQQAPPGTGAPTDATEQQAQIDIQNMVAGQVIAPPDHFDVTYVKAFLSFVQSGQFDALSPEVKQNFQQYVTELEQNFQNFAVATPNAMAPPVQQQLPV